MADHTSSSVELTQYPDNTSRISNTHEESAPENRQEFSLPPADGGKDAWLVLVAGFILEALVWGFPFSFGVFQEYYATHEFADQKESLAAIGTTATGVLYFAAPLVYAFLSRFPQYRRACSIGGFVILTAALIAASFATTVGQLLATQGVLFGVGGAIHYFPVFAYLDEWWITKKGIAYGIVMAGAGASGVVIPFVMRWCLESYGYQTALRVWAVVSVVFTVPSLFFLKGRLPERNAASAPRSIEWRFLKTSAFWTMEAANVLTSLGYFFPAIYLPSFAESVGLSPISGTIAVSLLNAATVIGALVIGVAVDRYHVTTAFNICAIGTILAVFFFWSFAVYTPVLFLFAILYGLTGGGSSATWAGVVQPVREKYPAVDAGMIVTMMAAGKGLGAVISGPLSGVLVSSDTWKDSLGYGFGSGYGYLIALTGVTASFGLIGWCGKKCGLV